MTVLFYIVMSQKYWRIYLLQYENVSVTVSEFELGLGKFNQQITDSTSGYELFATKDFVSY